MYDALGPISNTAKIINIKERCEGHRMDSGCAGQLSVSLTQLGSPGKDSQLKNCLSDWPISKSVEGIFLIMKDLAHCG